MSRVVNPSEVKILTEEERKARRSAKFGDEGKLNERAKRFGLSEDTANSGNTTSVAPNVDCERLKKRAERFGVVSDVVKKIDESEKLNKRKQRFGKNETNAVNDETKRKRIERFANKSLAASTETKTSPTKAAIVTTNNGQSSEANKVS